MSSLRRHVLAALAPFKLDRHTLPDLLLGCVAGVAVFGVIIGIMALAGWYRVSGAAGPQDAAGVLLTALVGFLIGALIEEVLFRGILYRLLEWALGSWMAVALSAAGFGLLHLDNPNATLAGAVAIALTAGLALAALYALRRSLWPVIGVHAGWNVAEGPLFGTPVSGISIPGSVLHANVAGPPAWTGGAFGPEASLITVAVWLAIGGTLLWLAQRRGRIVRPLWDRRRRRSLEA